MISLMWNLGKTTQINLFTELKQFHRHRKQTLVPKGKRGRDKIRSLGLADTLLYIKQISNKILLYST